MTSLSKNIKPKAQSKIIPNSHKNYNISEARSKEIDDFNKTIRMRNETWLDRAIISEIRKFNIDQRLASNIHNEVISPILRRVDFISLKPQAKETASREINSHIFTLIKDHLPEYSEMLEIDEDSGSIDRSQKYRQTILNKMSNIY